MKWYITGPGLLGMDEDAVKAARSQFMEMHATLEANNNEVCNPFNILDGVEQNPIKLTAEDYNNLISKLEDAIKSCDAILLLKGWETGSQALRDLRFAIDNGIAVYTEESMANL